MVESDQSVITLPEDLSGQFDRLERRLFRLETGVLIASCVAGAAGAYLLVFSSDRFWETPLWLRGVAFSIGAGAVAWTGSRWLKRWVLRRRTRKDLAAIVQRKFERLGDRLLGIVELSAEEKHQAGFSPELYRAAIRQVASEAAQYNFTDAVSARPFKRASEAAIVAGGLALVSILLFPKAGLNAALRAAAPWANVPRFTLVELAGLPGEFLAPHGESFTISGRVNYRSFWKPSSVAGWFGRLPAGDSKVEAGQFTLALSGKLEEGSLRIKVGDAMAHVRVKPVLRPSLRNLDATVQLPGYLKLPPREQSAQSGSLTVVEGSKASFKGQVSRSLQKAEAFASGAAVETKTEADQFTTAAIAMDGVNGAEFAWRDQFGFTNQAPWKLSILTQPDGGPIPELPDLSREISIIESEVLQLKVRARDDFGVQKIGLAWDLGANTNQPYDFSGQAETSDKMDFEQSFSFTPILLGVEPDTTIAVRGFATDLFPGRDPVETPSYRIHVLGAEQHAEMVRQRLEAVMARLEEVSRLEEKIANLTDALKADEKLSEEEAARKAEDIKDEQNQNAAALQEMAEEGMKNLREALKNPSFSEEVLSEWTKTMKGMKEMASQQMPKASKALGEASKSPKDKNEKLAEALDQEKEILQQLEQMQKQINKGLDDLQALTLAQRLRKMGAGEKEIHGKLETVIQDTIGMTPEELAPRHQKQNLFLAEQQLDARNKSKELQSEISRFFERTRKPNYGMVSKQMAEARTPEELDRVRELIEGNVGMQAMDTLALWSSRFEGWADLLEPKKNDSGGGGGPQGEPGEEEENFALRHLMALLRVREGQVNLRERTRMLDKDRRDEKFYKESANKLREAEAKLIESVDTVQSENTEQEMEPILRETSRSLQFVESLLARPQTDQATAKAQNEAVEKLTDAINMLNEKAKQGGQSGEPGQSQGEEMAFLMQMVQQQNPKPGMQGGFKPGMNMNGGDTDMRADPIKGNAVGKSDAPRATRKAGGTTANLPAEFREALENYYKEIEKGVAQ